MDPTKNANPSRDGAVRGYGVERRARFALRAFKMSKRVKPDSKNTDVEIVIDEQITVRELHERDAEELYTLVDRNRVHLGKWFPWVAHVTSADDTLKNIVDTRAKYRTGNGLRVCIEVGGSIMGDISLMPIDQTDRRARLGYWIASEGEGHGIMTRCCQRVLGYGFEELGLNRVVLRAEKENWRSRKLAERLGFMEMGSADESEVWLCPDIDLDPEYDPDIELVLYSLDAAVWNP